MTKNLNDSDDKTHGSRFFARLRGYFLAGILVTAPIAITFAVAIWFIELVDSQIVHLIPDYLNPDTYLKEYLGKEIGLPGVGLLFLVVVITLIGALTAGLVGRYIVQAWDAILHRMPFISGVYSASKQILETLLQNQSESFRQAVLVEYPRRDAWTIAFVTGNTQGEIKEKLEQEKISIYVPTTPNPTSGFLLFVPKEDVKPLDMPVEDALKLLISLGIVNPEDKKAMENKKNKIKNKS